MPFDSHAMGMDENGCMSAKETCLNFLTLAVGMQGMAL
jgi:hypothetical protein